jgi:hypothetical protein
MTGSRRAPSRGHAAPRPRARRAGVMRGRRK